MLQVYVISAHDLPKMDVMGKSDPYVNVYGCDYRDKFKCGQTEVIKKELNPVWDESCKNPFYIPFLVCKKLKFVIFDWDKVGGHDKIGTAKFDFRCDEFNVEKVIPIKSARNTKHFPTLTVKVILPTQPLQTSLNLSMKYLYFYLEFNPSQYNRLVHLQLFEFAQGGDIPFQHLAFGNKNNGLKMDSLPQHACLTGFTNCIRINLQKKNFNSFFVPFLSSLDYQGTVSICVAVSSKPDKLKDPKGKESFDVSQLNPSFLNKFDCTIQNTGQPETIFPGMCVTYINGQINFTTTQVFDRKNESSVISIAKKYARIFIPEVNLAKLVMSTGRPVTFFAMCQYHNLPLPEIIGIGLGWDTRTDLDVSVLIYSGAHFDGSVDFTNKKAYEGSIYHCGDNLTGKGHGDDENVFIDFKRLPDHVDLLVFSITCFTGRTFNHVKGGFFRIFDANTQMEWISLRLSKQKAKTALIFSFLYKYEGKWTIIPVMKYFNVRFAPKLVKHIEEFNENNKYIEKMIGRIVD